MPSPAIPAPEARSGWLPDVDDLGNWLLGAAQPRGLPHLALQDEHLLAKGQDLAVAIITEQLGDQGSKGREQHEKQMPEHAGRMTGQDGEVSSGAGRLERGDSGSPDHRD